jgi:environmental stress-induced protein Ves
VSRLEWEYVDKERFRVDRWSGGTTTQLAIHPATAQYSARNFAWRISTATIDVGSSEFTSLEGFRRILMVLEGEFVLVHEGHGVNKMKPFEQCTFDGGWNTRSTGKAKDFNLIYDEHLRAELNRHVLQEQDSMILKAGSNSFLEREQWSYRVWYAVNGALDVSIGPGGNLCRIQQGDALIITSHRSQLEETWRLVNAESGEVCMIDTQIFG